MPRGKPNDGSKNPGGRPKVYDPEHVADLIEKYCAESEDPYVEEFQLQQGFTSELVYRLAKENERISKAIKDIHEKQKMRTVRKAEAGEINPTFAIFKLKQKCYGWTDKTEVQSTNVNFDLEMTLEEAERLISKWKDEI